MKLLTTLYQSLLSKSDVSNKRVITIWTMILFTMQMLLEPALKSLDIDYRFSSEILIAELTLIATLAGVASWEVSKTKDTNTDTTK